MIELYLALQLAQSQPSFIPPYFPIELSAKKRSKRDLESCIDLRGCGRRERT